MNKIGLSIKGEYTDTIRYANGDVEVVKGENLIVDGLLRLVTTLLGVKSGYTGLKYWAVGQGNSSWDTSTPDALTTDTELTNEIGRKQISASDMTWVTSSGSDSSTPTNRLKVRVTFGANECVGTWREFGLFGGNATDSRNSGIMINHKNHSVITKTNEMEIEREIIFTFSK